VRDLVLIPFLVMTNTITVAMANDEVVVTQSTQEVEHVVDEIQRKYESVDSMAAAFVQVTRSVTLGEVQQSGTVLFQRPNKMRWDFAEPNSSAFVSDGETMWVWSSDNNQVIITETSPDLDGQGVGQLLTDLGKLDELFDVGAYVGSPLNENEVCVNLTPRKATSFKRLALVLSKEDYLLTRVIMVDEFDGVVELLLSNVELDGAVSKDRFVFEIPSDATVVRSSEM